MMQKYKKNYYVNYIAIKHVYGASGIILYYIM